MARTRTTYTGDPGEVWVNETGRVQFQFIANWQNTCGVCAQLDSLIGASFPIPLHRGCRCRQKAVFPGQQAEPFTDFQATIATLDPVQQSRVVGRSNLTLIEQGVVKWEDVVTRTRVRDFREVVARGNLSVKQMTAAGVNPRLAAEAYTTVHTPAHELAAAQRQTLLDQLIAKGLTKDQVRQALAERLAARVGINRGPSGPGPSPIVPGTPSPKPPPVAPPVLPARVKRKPTSIPLPIPLISGGSPEAVQRNYLKSLGATDEAIAKVQPETHEQKMAKRVEGEIARLKAERAAAELEAAELVATADAKAAANQRTGTSTLRGQAIKAEAKARELKAIQKRYEDWQVNVKVNPSLIPPFAIEERLKIYGERGGNEKLKAIQALDKGPVRDPVLEALNAKAAELQAAYAKLSPKKDYAAREQVANELYNLNVRRRSLERKAEADAKLQNGAIAELIKAADPIGVTQKSPDTSYLGVAPLDPKLQPSIDAGLDFLRAIVSRGSSKDLAIPFGSVAHPDRARSSCSATEIVLTPLSPSAVTVHEVGHWIDHKMGVGATARDFLDYRVGDEQPRPMADVVPGSKYGPEELGRKDRFDEAFGESSAYYIGKVQGGSTEITAMGLEKLYNDPVTFATKDPEYFSLILGILDGSLR